MLQNGKANGDVRSSLQDNTVVLDLILHHPSQTRTEKADKVNTTADKSYLRIKKKIFESDEFKVAFGIELETYYWCKARALPVGMTGFFVIPVALIGEVYDFLDKQDARLKKAVQDFVDGYEKMKSEAKKSLGDMYREGDYYSPAELKASFYMERKLWEISPPSAEKVGEVVANLEKNKAAVRWQEAEKEVIFCLRESFRDLVSHLAEKLQPKDDGSKKRFYGSSIEKTIEWIELFKNRNVLGDAELETLVKKTHKILTGKGVTLEDIREDENLRAKLAKDMGKVKDELDKCVEAAPARKISFDE